MTGEKKQSPRQISNLKRLGLPAGKRDGKAPAIKPRDHALDIPRAPQEKLTGAAAEAKLGKARSRARKLAKQKLKQQ